MKFQPLARGAILLLLAGIGLGVHAQERADTATPDTATPDTATPDTATPDTMPLLADQPRLPDGVAPLDPSLEDELEALIESAVRYRGLALREALAVGTQDADAARRTIVGLLAEELPPAEADTAERTLVALGLWPEDLDLTEVLVEVLVSEVAGYYDPERDYLALVGDGLDVDLGSAVDGANGEADDEQDGEDLMARMNDAIWVHEIGHALQDQHFDLEAMGHDEELLSDVAMARDALVEGDATLLMFNFLLGLDIARMADSSGLLGGLLDDPDQASNLLGGSAIERAPAYLQQGLVFPYFQGLSFCLAVSRRGGLPLIDYAFRKDPPRSTEQILHPEKWLDARDEPVEITLPDLSRQLGRREPVLRGTLGEMTLRILFAERLPDAEQTTIRDAAAGWGGDAVALFRTPDADPEGDVVVWVSEWDTRADADEVESIASRAFPPPWTWRRSGTRLAFVRGLVGGKARRVLQALLESPSVRPPAVPLDLDALGITIVDDMPVDDTAQVDDVSSTEDSQASDVFAGLADMAEAIGDEGLAGVDLEELLESPEMNEVAARLLAQSSNPAVAVAGNRVSIPDLGFEARLPDAGDWTVRTSLESVLDSDADAGEGLAPAFEADDDSTGAFVSITAVALPMALPIETVAMGVRAAPVLDDAEELRGGFAGEGRGRAFEREVRGRQLGQNLRLVQRLHVLDGTLVVLLAGGADADWTVISPLVDALVGSITITDPKSAP